MKDSMLQIIDEAIQLELNMSRLYGIFSEHIVEDRAFWFRLEIEEKNHAALLKTGKDFAAFKRFPSGLIPDNLKVLQESNWKVLEAIDKFVKNPDRELAFKLASDLENSAGEIHFQRFMETNTTDDLGDIFQKLNQADKDHAERIYRYWQDVIHSSK